MSKLGIVFFQILLQCTVCQNLISVSHHTFTISSSMTYHAICRLTSLDLTISTYDIWGVHYLRCMWDVNLHADNFVFGLEPVNKH
jgi:hypothetical protein